MAAESVESILMSERNPIAMKMRKSFSRATAAFIATAMLASVTAVPAFAESGVAGNDAYTTGFNKVIDMSDAEGASVPRLNYSYDADPGERVPATDTNPEIETGVGNIQVKGVTFSEEDERDAGTDTVTKQVAITIPANTYSEPGIYRYVITETDDTKDVAGMTETENDDTYYLDVYVEDHEGKLTVTHTILTRTEITPVLDDSGENVTYGEGEASKVEEDVDKYTTYTLTITKKVQGEMANVGGTFNFAVDFEGLDFGTILTSGEDKAPSDRTDTDGKLTVDFSIAEPGRDGKSYVIYGVPADAAYTVIEKLSDGEGYTVKAERTSGGSGTPAEPVEGNPAGFALQYIDREGVTQSVQVGCAVLDGETLKPITDAVPSAESFTMSGSPNAISALSVPTLNGYVNANTAYVNDGGKLVQVQRVRFNAGKWEYQAADKQYYALNDNSLYFIYAKDNSGTVEGPVDMTYNEEESSYVSSSFGMNGQDNVMVVTNIREAANPTGLVMDIAPYVLLVVAAAAGCFIFMRKRRED